MCKRSINIAAFTLARYERKQAMNNKDMNVLHRCFRIQEKLNDIRSQFDWKTLFETDGDTDLIKKLNEFESCLESKLARFFLNWSDEAKRLRGETLEK